MKTLAALRPEQWVKNLLVFVPLIFGKSLFSVPALLKATEAFLIFCAAAGAAYLMNDLSDLAGDRSHPVKKGRPIASGALSVTRARSAAAFLAAASVTAAFLLDAGFGWVIAGYLALNLAYDRFFKMVAVADVVSLGVFFLLRIAAGSILADAVMSRWVILLTFLLALFLGLNKRRQELALLGGAAPSCRRVLGAYTVTLLDRAASVIAFLILAGYVCYVIDPRTAGYYGNRLMAWSAPFVFFGVARYSYLIRVAKRSGDPSGVLLSDPPLKIDILIWVLVCVLVIYHGS